VTLIEDLVSRHSRGRSFEPNYNSVIPLTKTVLTLLAHRVPITLLADLLDPAGPPSREIYRVEAVSDDIQREMAFVADSEAGSGERHGREGTGI